MFTITAKCLCLCLHKDGLVNHSALSLVIGFILAVNIAVAGCAAEDSLHGYCGAGLSELMEEIADLFEELEGVQIDYTFGGSAQHLSQIVLCKLSV